MKGGRTMFKEFNAHPKGIKTTDCVVRGISTATSSDYLEVRRELNRKKKELGSQVIKIHSSYMNT